MGKRSSFERVERDFYPTPMEAVLPLFPHLAPRTNYIEPCAGDGSLIKHINLKGHSCIFASDIEPKAHQIVCQNVFTLFRPCETFITNPPWDRKILHPLIEHLQEQGPTWLLFDADWKHTRQSSKYLKHLKKIVSVGRVKWIPNSTMTGKDNCCWYLFDKCSTQNYIQFFGR